MTVVKVIQRTLDFPEHTARQIITLLEYKFDRYNNPFERKWTMRKTGLDSDLYYHDLIYDRFMTTTACWWISNLLNVPIERAEWRQYGGVFVYQPGDYLQAHVDAGIHPVLKQVKVATLVIYLTPAQLEFWHGDPAHYSKPVVYHSTGVYTLEAGDAVLFTNDQFSWHSVPIIEGEPRVCITCSYLAPEGFTRHDFSNNRTRAYFAHHEDEPYDSIIENLRELRASEEGHKSVYKTNT